VSRSSSRLHNATRKHHTNGLVSPCDATILGSCSNLQGHSMHTSYSQPNYMCLNEGASLLKHEHERGRVRALLAQRHWNRGCGHLWEVSCLWQRLGMSFAGKCTKHQHVHCASWLDPIALPISGIKSALTTPLLIFTFTFVLSPKGSIVHWLHAGPSDSIDRSPLIASCCNLL
jgi:hypothetical protein